MKMLKIKYFFVLFIIFFIFGCSRRLPEDMNHFIGAWKGKNILLIIKENGNISCTKFNNSYSINTCGPVKYIGDDKIIYSVFFKKITISIQKPPCKCEDQWRMVVENIDLIKTDEQEWSILNKFLK